MCLNSNTLWYYFSTFFLQSNVVSGDTIEFSAVSVNHKQCEYIENEEPPPLPPPRGESLKRPHLMETQLNPTSNHGTHVLHHEQLEELLFVGWFVGLQEWPLWSLSIEAEIMMVSRRDQLLNVGCEQQEGRVMLGILHILKVFCLV